LPRCASAADKSTADPVVYTLNDALDTWRNVRGGLDVGDATLNKLQILVDLNGQAIGLPRWRARLQYFRTSGQALSGGKVGDIQTIDNIEAVSVDRLMEAWVERNIGDQAAIRAGLMDLNATFDSIEPAGLFLNSSHGIGPDLAGSGLNGPSIFPVSSVGVHLNWKPSNRLNLQAAAFDGVSGDPDHPGAFAAVQLRRSDGALLIGQVDWFARGNLQISLGAWTYTASFDRIDQPGRRQKGWAGVYAFVEGSLPIPNAQGWVRIGRTDPDVAAVAGYLGLGVVFSPVLPGRPNDQLGFALARAGLGDPIRRRDGLPSAETTFEVTYQVQLNDRLSLQPDVQYVRHPASQPGVPDALAVGLRVSFSTSGSLIPTRPAPASRAD
jgi:porin